jgi:hypothetical protein
MDLVDYDVSPILRGIKVECPGSCFSLSGGGTYPTMVKVEMTISQASLSSNPLFAAEVELEDTFILRGTY